MEQISDHIECCVLSSLLSRSIRNGIEYLKDMIGITINFKGQLVRTSGFWLNLLGNKYGGYVS